MAAFIVSPSSCLLLPAGGRCVLILGGGLRGGLRLHNAVDNPGSVYIDLIVIRGLCIYIEPALGVKAVALRNAVRISVNPFPFIRRMGAVSVFVYPPVFIRRFSLTPVACKSGTCAKQRDSCR